MYCNFGKLDARIATFSILVATITMLGIPISVSFILGHSKLMSIPNLTFLVCLAAISAVVFYKRARRKKDSFDMKRKYIWLLLMTNLAILLLYIARSAVNESDTQRVSNISAEQLDAEQKAVLEGNRTFTKGQEEIKRESASVIKEETALLISSKGMEAKLDKERELQQQRLTNTAKAKASLAKHELLALQKASIDFVDMAKNGQWEQFVSAFEGLEHYGSEMLDLSLYQAVVLNAPWTVIDELITKGANITDGLALVLASKNNLELFSKLVEKGLNIHATDYLGKNTIEYSLKGGGNKLEFVKFLLQNNVSLTPSYVVRDPLDSAIEGYSKGAVSLAVVSILMDYGAQIEQSHKQALLLLKQSDSRKYQKLTQFIPELTL